MQAAHRPLLYWLRLLAFLLLLTPIGFWLFSVAALVTAVTVPLQHPVCCDSPTRFGAKFEKISFRTADGLTLRGWYIPPKNGAVIILLHPYYGNRMAVMRPAEMLYQHGYGLLMYDQRASGESDGTIRTLGWLDIPDVQQAANFVATRYPGVKIGVSGCSSGGAIALGGAAFSPEIGAVAADAPSPLSWEENRPDFRADPFHALTFSAYFHIVAIKAGTYAPISTLEAIQAVSPRPILFISTGQGGEQARVQSYYETASGPKVHLNLPDSGHCAAPYTHPVEYEQALVEFFDTHLK
jgi:fermentation-respiration switch protein FrsA (DUF1100 family)